MDCDNDSDNACYGVCCWSYSIASDKRYLGDGQPECGINEQYNEYVYEFRAIVDYSNYCCGSSWFYDDTEEF